MRLFSWAGAIAMLGAGGIGYFACELIHNADPLSRTEIIMTEGSGETSEPPTQAQAAPRPIEEIDLSCTQTLPYSFASQSAEPPLANADSAPTPIRLVSYEVPASSPDDCEFRIMPYLTDDAAPTKLPSFIEIPVIVPIPVTPPDEQPNPNHPLYQQVKSYFETWTVGPVTDPIKHMHSQWMDGQPNDDVTPLRQKPDTTEIRRGDLPSKTGGGAY